MDCVIKIRGLEVKIFALIAAVFSTMAHAETTMTTLNYVERGLFGTSTYKLETTVYEPTVPNGQVVIFNHGSTGKHADVVKKTIKYVNIGSMFEKAGYTVIVPMRKGRGNSEGTFTEETGSCEYGRLQGELAEATRELGQIIDQVKERYHVDKVILMGHSRGGLLSATYAATHPDQVTKQ